MRPLLLGAVAYDPKVVTIWDGFKAFFEQHGLPFDYVLFHNYERQVAAHFAGVIDVAWNSPLAWIQAERIAARRGRSARAIAMRDSDQDLTSIVLVRADGPTTVGELSGKTVGVGAQDSPQATLLPLLHLAELGAACTAKGHDVLVGKHGDHVGGERDAVRALLRGDVDAACIIDGNLATFTHEGTVPGGALRVLTTTAPYDHCNFTVLDGLDPEHEVLFLELLMGMRWEDPAVRALMDMEGLRAWRLGRTSGYAALDRACTRFGTIDPFVDALAR